MNIGCTQMHVVTMTAIILELIILGAQSVLLMHHPEDRPRFWYALLLVQLILVNVTGGLFPDPAYTIPIHIQNIIDYGFGFLLASYFPFYFYKAFDLKGLRFHAYYGVPLFLLLPYLGFFVVSYSIHRDLEFTYRWGFVVPFFYSLVLLAAILRAIRVAYRENRNKNFYVEEIAVYCAVAPWSVLTLIVYFNLGQLAETLFINIGFLAVSGMFIFRSVRQVRSELAELAELKKIGLDYSPFFEANCTAYGLTEKETATAGLLRQGLRNKAIAVQLDISEGLVKKQVEIMFRKTGATSRYELIQLLAFVPPPPTQGQP